MLKRWSVILLALMSCAVIACDDDDDNGTNNNNNDGGNNNGTSYANTMTATINGQAFTATNILSVGVATGSIRSISVTGTDASGRSIALALAASSGAKNYTIDGQLVTATADDGTIEASENSSGNINITNVTDDGIKATFSYTVRNNDGDVVTVANGSVDAEFSN